MLAAVNGMLLDMLAAIARKDYENRRRRQAEGTAKAKAAGRYRGRPEGNCSGPLGRYAGSGGRERSDFSVDSSLGT